MKRATLIAFLAFANMLSAEEYYIRGNASPDCVPANCPSFEVRGPGFESFPRRRPYPFDYEEQQSYHEGGRDWPGRQHEPFFDALSR